ncbi:MAG: PEP-CTERM sorting domain-containing protein [Planctomycetota bacterium]
MNLYTRILAASSLALTVGSASAVSTFTETFDANDSGWLDETGATPDYFATGGVGGSGYISYTPAPFNSGAGGFGDPLAILLRGNAGSASGDAFVGDWLTSGVQTFSVDVRHNYDTALNLYTRLNRGFGQAASSANNAIYTIAPNTWTTLTLEIEDTNPPFVSYGAGSFASVFSGIADVQVGLYLPANTDFNNLTFDLDNVNVTVPEPASLGVVALAGLASLRRRRSTAG